VEIKKAARMDGFFFQKKSTFWLHALPYFSAFCKAAKNPLLVYPVP
jgi:hypothetical protein